MKQIDENTFISNGWKWQIHFKQDGIAVAFVSPDNDQVTRNSGWELNILEPSGRWSMVAGHCFDYGYDGKGAALAVAEQLVKMQQHERMVAAANLYAAFRNNILHGMTQATQWSASPVIA
jgi:hypothetical protein